MEAIPVHLPEKSAWKVQSQVVWALYIRETKTRFGKYQLGLLWAIIESLASVCIKALIFGIFLRAAIPSMPYAIFLLTGFLPFALFSGLITRGLSAINSNEGLLVYRQLKPIDPFLARVMLEILVFSISVAVFFVIASWFGAVPDFNHPLKVLFAVLSLVMMASGISIFLGMMAHNHKELEKIVPLITHPIMFISCVLFPLSSVPSNHQVYFIWNPLVVIFETIRKGLYADYPTVDLPILYPFCIGLISLSFGLTYYWSHRNQHYLGSSR